MGVIRKKTAARGAEGGVKYVCDVCSADITSTVSCSPRCSVSMLIIAGPDKMRSQLLQRIRPLRPLLLERRILP